MKHPPELIALARKLWDEGLSAAAIAQHMGLTKGVISGISDRNDFPARPIPPKFRNAPKRARKPTPNGKRRPETLLAAQLRSHAGLVARTTAAVRMPEVHIAAARGCQYPAWSDDEKPTHLYCDAPIANGSYCEAHAAKCFRVVRDAQPFMFGWGTAA